MRSAERFHEANKSSEGLSQPMGWPQLDPAQKLFGVSRTAPTGPTAFEIGEGSDVADSAE